MSLLSLPNELLLQILPSLTEPDDITRSSEFLATVSRTNRRLHTLVEPFIYSTFEATESSIGPFLRTIVERPRLGEYTTTVANEVYLGKDWVLSEEQQSIADSAVKVILN
jgi:hypothetical protein